MAGERRLVAVILEVSDLERSAALYRDGRFGLVLHAGDNEVDDRWTGGRHAEISWRDGAYLHFALYPAKERPTAGALISIRVDDIDSAHLQAERAGARVLHAPRHEPWGRSGRYEDLDGNAVALGVGSCCRQHRGADVHIEDLGAFGGGQDGFDPAAGAHVDYSLAFMGLFEYLFSQMVGHGSDGHDLGRHDDRGAEVVEDLICRSGLKCLLR